MGSSVKKRTCRRGPVNYADLQCLLEACELDRGLSGRQDAALIVLLCSVGIPANALCELHVDNYSREGAILNVRGWAGPVEISSRVASFLHAWLAVRGPTPGPMFSAITKSGRLARDGITLQMLSQVLWRRTRQAKIQPFSLQDVHRTHMLLCCGQWRTACCCSYPPGREVIPLTPEQSNRQSGSSDNIVFGYLCRLRPPDRSRALNALDRFAQLISPDANARTLPWAHLRVNHIPPPHVLRAAFDQRTLDFAKRAFNGVLHEAIFHGVVKERIARALQHQHWTGPRSGPSNRLSREQFEALLDECRKDDSPHGARDGALIALLWVRQYGVSQAIELNVGIDQRELLESLATTRDIFVRWLDVRGKAPGPLLQSLTRTGKLTGRPMTRWSIRRTLQRRCAEVGIFQVAPDQVRIAAIRVVQQSASHSSIEIDV